MRSISRSGWKNKAVEYSGIPFHLLELEDNIAALRTATVRTHFDRALQSETEDNEGNGERFKKFD